MNSIQTKTKKYHKLLDHCIALIVVLPEESGRFRIYVAWEWEDMAEQGVFGFAKSRSLYSIVDTENIIDAADYGVDIGGTEEGKKIFKSIL